MRFGKRLSAALVIVAAGLVARADLPKWVEHQPAGTALDVLLRSMSLPGGPVRFKRPPSETRPALTRLIGAEPKNGALFRLRAHEAEMQLDFVAAENDWKAYADMAADRGAGYLMLADFYHRRVKAADEIKALAVVGQSTSNAFVPAPEQRSWLAYARMLPVIKDAGLPVATSSLAFRSWIARYPTDQTPRQEFINFLVEQKQYASVETQIGAYSKSFPNDEIFPVMARANLAAKRNSDDAALRTYDLAFQPLWPKQLSDAYFALLDTNWQLREFLGRARSAREKNPVDINAAGRMFAYYQHANNLGAARRVLLEYRLAKEAKPGSWTQTELRTLAGLFERLPDANEQARAYYALYSLPGATADDRETALSGMVQLLLTKPDEPIRFGSGDLSLYKDIGTADSSLGFLNGLLSLVLNSTAPRSQYEQQNRTASAYFHRAEGAELLELLEKQFPSSPHRAGLRASLVDSYASYGDDDGVLTAGRTFLVTFTKAPERTHVALTLADALARRNLQREEFALYQRLLKELAANAGGVPLGVHDQTFTVAQDSPNVPQKQGARSFNYATILDRYLARISAVGMPMDALRVYRAELDRNPNDPGIYERFSGFLEQNNLSADVQDVYRRAIAKFPDRSWYSKLARWYLRGKQEGAYVAISREATGIFSGTELEAYFGDLVQPGNFGPQLYVQLNLFAHQRFPEDLVFVRNLLGAYRTKETLNSSAASALLHDYWFYDTELKRRYFEELSAQGQLLSQIGKLRSEHPEIQHPETQKDQWPQLAAANPGAAQFHAEAEAWQGHYEAAAPAMKALAELYPGALDLDARASSLYRSLAYFFPADTAVAVAFAQKASDANPGDTKLLEIVGDVYSDKHQFVRASAVWNAIPRVFPGKPDGYLESATVFWDYYRFGDALRQIGQARLKYGDKALFAYEGGAIEEGRRDYPRAAAEYLAGSEAGNEAAHLRLVRLASRPAQRDLIYQLTARASPALRIDVLKAQQRKPELESFLAKEITVATQVPEITPLLETAREQGFDPVVKAALEREIEVVIDPVERMRLRIELVKYFEARKDLGAATRTMDSLYRDNPLVLGVIRARVDFEKRNERYGDAITVLTESAAKSRADLSAEFRFEAARIATGDKRVDQARALLGDLLKAAPYRADYLAQMADTYAAANDDTGFVQFANTEIDALKKAPLPVEDRRSRIAALRRRLVVTLARRDDYAGAVGQYIEVINQYPEDQAVTREAALFASAHGRRDQLISFYRKTITEAPRDWRWPIVLARIETTLEDYPAALIAYDAAMKARPDRADLVQARAELEERLLRFDDAIQTYLRLYALTYNDPQWLDKAAEFQARLGHGKDAVRTLERAHIGPGGETVTALFAIARKLDEWHLQDEAIGYSQRGFALAGNDLWPKYPDCGVTYGRIMAEARRMDAVLALDVKDDWVSQRGAALREAATRVAELYTPEEKVQLVARIEARRLPPNPATLEFAKTAGLEQTLAQFYYANWMSGDEGASTAWMNLQSQRGLYEQVSRDLEVYANGPGRNAAAVALQQAAVSASQAGDTATEMRLYGKLQTSGLLGQQSWDRYLSLLMANDPKSLVALAGKASAKMNDRAVQFAIASGQSSEAMQAIQARSQALPPVWLAAYTALAGVYFDDRAPKVTRAFLTALHPATIGQRLGSKPDANRYLAGSLWFYYGSRYGEYLTRSGSAAAPDYLSSALEQRPGDPEAYLSLARFYAGAKQPAGAIAEFRKVLDLDANRGEAHDGIARALMEQGRRADAVAEWRGAIAAFQREQSRGVRVRESFWMNVSATFLAIADAKVFPELQSDVHGLLADYVHRNGAYRVQELINPALEASFRSNVGFDWMMDILLQTDGPEFYLPGLSDSDQERLATFRLAYEIKQAGTASGYEKVRLEQQSFNGRIALVNLLLSHGKPAEALVQWRLIQPAELALHQAELAPVEIRLTAATGTIAQLLSRFRAIPGASPRMDELLAASMTLRQDGHVAQALSLLNYAYSRELDAQHLEAANFLGLARVLLERGDSLEEAMGVLRRMTLVASAPFEGFEPAADLLMEFHHRAEARDFLSKAIAATPWNSSARLKLMRISNRADRKGLVLDQTADYSVRAEAARLMAPANVAAGGELGLLASGDKSAAAAQKPFYVESRWTSAAGVPDPLLQLSLLRKALAIAPEDQRVRLAAVRAALKGGKDSLALAMYQVPAPRSEFMYRPQRIEMVRAGDADLLESLSGAAERNWDFTGAVEYLNQALQQQLSGAERQRIEAKRAGLNAEQKRRNENAQRQPVVTNKLEQPHTVRARELP